MMCSEHNYCERRRNDKMKAVTLPTIRNEGANIQKKLPPKKYLLCLKI